ncbi:uncharacterized protein LOC143352364 isoform X2 [Halictus rubicundus]|uniref:uncharacterized protein LOC143352364 isoform X2 n=1 Tax=Halictus rubicundus TaxID=77578 RepID=UPI004036AD0E
MVENLTLILDDNHFEADKEKLASKSRYFKSLLSGNFSDSHNKEHTINYDIALPTFKDFIEWVHDDKEEHRYADCYNIKQSMTKFMKDNFEYLIDLLKLSVLFMVDELTNDIVDIIVLFWLKPEIVIRIWQVAQKLSLKLLQDICLSVCLDRFEELPLVSLAKLKKPLITSLLQNVNVRASSKFLQIVREEWRQNHMGAVIPDVKQKRQPKFIQGTVVYQKYEGIIEDAHLYIWNGTDFSRGVQIRDIQDSERGMVGMHVIGRGFNIYTVGGELGFGTGKFNHIIWRYCLLSKKWYYQATLRVPRRHMVAAFVKNKLIIVGGLGRHRLKLSSVDILDIHTGVWNSGADIPESFTMVPPHCVMDGKLFIMKSALYIYNPKEDCWKTIEFLPNYSCFNWDVCLTNNSTLFRIGVHLGKTVLSRVDVVKEPTCEKIDCLKQYMEHKGY